jgi:trehalose 6-phosphate synthase
MGRLWRFFGPLLFGLALLTAIGYFALVRTTRSWFERDVALRSQLAVGAARLSLSREWAGGREPLTEVLNDLARDERIMAAAACAPDGRTLAATPAFPSSFSCRSILDRMSHDAGPHATSWSMVADIPSGRVHISVSILDNEGEPRGAIILLHDLSYLGRRETTTRNIIFATFFILSLGAALVTLLTVRLTRRDWTASLRRALTGDASREFQPLLRDVRALAERLSRERATDARAGAWSATRLRATLRQSLQGERIVILANREPYIHMKTATGVEVLHPASGLVTALEPVMRACSGVWVAHGGGTADRETVDAHDRIRVPPGAKSSEDSYWVRRVWLSEAEEQGYYYGFSNEGLWPLCHLAHARPVFRAEDWDHYVRVNRRFAEAVCNEVDSDDPIILVQDYHFALAPRMIRERLPRATIITFWHIPWPNAERIGICPWREDLLAGLLGSSILGFHTQQHCNNFMDSVDSFMESRIDREKNAVVQGARTTLVRAYPISIEWPVRWLAQIPTAEEARLLVRQELGLPKEALLGVGIDRLDYTKGVEERLAAVDELLTRHPEYRGRFTFVQLAAPSRTKIDRYRELNARVEQLADEINAKWGQGSYKPIMLLRAHHQPDTVFRFYRAAELCYVSSLHDGMNLVAKEFVAARDDEQGVLVLSEFTGAARELTEALVVNPYDLREASGALATALAMSPEEQRERMRSMRRLVSEFNVYRWAGRMLMDATELRRKERMLGTLSQSRRSLHPEAG